jgi:heme/copper-type cytochrome/quinol oxidase subunit 2
MIDPSNPQPASSKEAKKRQAVPSVPLNTVWMVFTVCSVCWILVHGSSVISYQREARRHNFPVNELSDLWMMVVALIVITVFRAVIISSTSEQIKARQLLVDPAAGEVKIDKSVRAFVGIVWYTICTVKCSYFRCTASTSSQDTTIYLKCCLEDASAMS